MYEYEDEDYFAKSTNIINLQILCKLPPSDLSLTYIQILLPEMLSLKKGNLEGGD